MKEKAKTVAVTVNAFVHLMGLMNVLHSLETTGWRTEFLGSEISVEQDWESHP